MSQLSARAFSVLAPLCIVPSGLRFDARGSWERRPKGGQLDHASIL